MVVANMLDVIDLRRIGAPQAQMIGELLDAVWPKPGASAATRAEKLCAVGREEDWSDRQAPRSFVLFELGRVIAHAAIVPRRIRTSQGEMVVGALAMVCTDPSSRGRGLGEQVVRAALETVDRGDFVAALFQTSGRVAPFYQRLGCESVDNRFVNSLAEDPQANPFWDEVAMRYPAHGSWPEGEIDLLGPGF